MCVYMFRAILSVTLAKIDFLLDLCYTIYDLLKNIRQIDMIKVIK